MSAARSITTQAVKDDVPIQSLVAGLKDLAMHWLLQTIVRRAVPTQVECVGLKGADKAGHCTTQYTQFSGPHPVLWITPSSRGHTQFSGPHPANSKGLR